MKIRSLVLTLFLGICYTVGAQDSSFQENIITYLKLNGTESQYNRAFDEMFVMLGQQFGDANVPEEEWTAMKSSKEEDVSKVLAMIASAYRKHFTEAEIKEMNTFYSSYVGAKLAKREEKITAEDNKEIVYFFNSEVGKKISEKQQDLSKDIIEISEYWSRDLFMSNMNALVAKGYETRQ